MTLCLCSAIRLPASVFIISCPRKEHIRYMGLYEAIVNISQSTVSNNLPTVKKHPREDLYGHNGDDEQQDDNA
jgi:hypothetical protein